MKKLLMIACCMWLAGCTSAYVEGFHASSVPSGIPFSGEAETNFNSIGLGVRRDVGRVYLDGSLHYIPATGEVQGRNPFFFGRIGYRFWQSDAHKD